MSQQSLAHLVIPKGVSANAELITRDGYRLTADDLNQIEAVAPKGVAAGDRYPADITSLQQALTNSRRSKPN